MTNYRRKTIKTMKFKCFWDDTDSPGKHEEIFKMLVWPAKHK